MMRKQQGDQIIQTKERIMLGRQQYIRGRENSNNFKKGKPKKTMKKNGISGRDGGRNTGGLWERKHCDGKKRLER